MSADYQPRRLSAADADAADALDLRISVLVRGVVNEAVSEAAKAHALTVDEREWIRLAMRREARREKLHTAIIEKSLAGLVWAAVLGLGVVFYEWAKSHGYKP